LIEWVVVMVVVVNTDTGLAVWQYRCALCIEDAAVAAAAPPLLLSSLSSPPACPKKHNTAM
jgi:hypothetical protein